MTENKSLRYRAKSKATPAEGTASATLRHVRISPRKLRLMMNLIKGKQLEPAEQILKFNNKKAAQILLKVVNSAKFNARETKGLDLDKLWVTAGWVDMGRVMRRFMPRAQGRATPIKKRTSHVTLVLSER